MPDPAPPAAPAVPASAQPPSPPAGPPKVDPFVQRLARSFAVAVDDDFNLKPLTPEAEPNLNGAVQDVTIGEQMRGIAKIKHPPPPVAPAVGAPPPTPQPPQNGTPPAPVPAVQPPPPPPTPPAAVQPPTGAPAAGITVRRAASEEILEIQRKIQEDLERLNARANAPPPAVPSPAAGAPAGMPPAGAEAEYDATLPEENREVIELLQWAEAKQPEFKGKAAEQRNYFRKLDEFIAGNPEADQIEEFKRNNRPQVSDGTIRKLNRQKIIEETKAATKAEILKETEARIAPIVDKQYEMQVTPHLQQMGNEFINRFATVKPGSPSVGEKRLDPVKGKAILEQGFEKARQDYSIEAPILAKHKALADDYLRVAYGLQALDEGNAQDLSRYLFNLEMQMASSAPEHRTRNGKTWLPASQFNQLMGKDEETAKATAAKYWSLGTDPAFVLDRLEHNAHLLIAKKYEEVEKQAEQMGFVKKPAEPAAPVAPLVPPAVPPAAQTQPPPLPAPGQPGSSGGSPRAGVSRAPGAAVNTPPENPNAQFMESLYPGSTKVLNAA